MKKGRDKKTHTSTNSAAGVLSPSPPSSSNVCLFLLARAGTTRTACNTMRGRISQADGKSRTLASSIERPILIGKRKKVWQHVDVHRAMAYCMITR